MKRWAMVFIRCVAIAVIVLLTAFASSGIIADHSATDSRKAEAWGNRKMPFTLNWDLSHGVDITEIGWPASYKQDVWILQQPHMLYIKFADGEAGQLSVQGITVWRKRGQITSIMLSFEDAPLAQACDDARVLGRAWKITDFSKLDFWQKVQSRDPAAVRAGVHNCSVYRDDLDPPRRVEVTESFDLPQTHPWLRRLIFGFAGSTRE